MGSNPPPLSTPFFVSHNDNFNDNENDNDNDDDNDHDNDNDNNTTLFTKGNT